MASLEALLIASLLPEDGLEMLREAGVGETWDEVLATVPASVRQLPDSRARAATPPK